MTTRYAQDLALPLPVILSDGSVRYVYGQERLFGDAGSTRTWYLGDALGSVRTTLDDAGSVIASASYDPWGALQSTTIAPFGFTGELQGADGLTYLRARWYDSTTGRFAGFRSRTDESFDTIPYSYHPYQYAYSDPVLYSDPTGKYACLAPAASRRDSDIRNARSYTAFCHEQRKRLLTSMTTGNLSNIRAIDGLLALFSDPELPGGTSSQAEKFRQGYLTEAQERLEFVLWYTLNGPFKHFENVDFWSGQGKQRWDEGFASEFQDSAIWIDSSRQVGHFLTAADMGYSPQFLEVSLMACMIGHEKIADQEGIPHNIWQCLHTSNIDIQLFRSAVIADQNHDPLKRDCFIARILPNLPESLRYPATNGFEDPLFTTRSGNSRQDLRLSIKGWIFGQRIRDRQITTLAEAQTWIRAEIQDE